jgi:uncharacterized protein YecA (UPF0149 family)
MDIAVVTVVVRCLMLSTGLLTTDDLNEIGCAIDDQSPEVAAELVDAVDQSLVADQANAGYALMLAAEITERAGDLPGAQVLAGRAAEAYRTHSDSDHGYSRAFHAELLLRLGREDEGMAELTALRPLLSQDTDAVSYITRALTMGGYTPLAEQWLTEELMAMLHRLRALDSQTEEPAYDHAVTMAAALVTERYEVRRGLDLTHDEHDHLAELVTEVVHEALCADQHDNQGAALLFWPQLEFDRLLARWPVLAEEYGHTWEEYRTTVQQTLVQVAESGVSRLVLLAGFVDELTAYADDNGGDPADPLVHEGYVQDLGGHLRETAWPPGRNQACWCGSALKYKKCCLPRARA